MNMSAPLESWDDLLCGLAGGDDRAYQEFWNLYGERLTNIVRRRLPTSMQQRVEPEDLVQSVCRTFVRRLNDGQIQLVDRDRLWRLLCAISLNKIRMQIRFQHQQRRSPNRESPSQSQDEDSDWIEELGGNIPSPDDEAMFGEQLGSLLEKLDEEERGIVQLKLEGWDNDEIATKLGCSERTVRRLTQKIRERLCQWLLTTVSGS